MRSVYFTIDTGVGGFTDQLFQFSTFYKLGVSLGYSYLHQPFRSARSSAKVYDMLGFDRYLLPEGRLARIRQALLLRGSRVIELPLNDAILEEKGIRSLSALRKHVTDVVAAGRQGRRAPLVRFRWAYQNKGRGFFKWVNSEMVEYPDDLDLRGAYFRVGAGRTAVSLFPPDGLRVLVHIRQGDTAVVETPWNTFIPQRGRDAFQQLEGLRGSSAARVLEVADYRDFVSEFRAVWESEPIHVRVFSDGYQRAFARLYSHPGRTGLTRDEIAELKASQATYGQRKFAVFDEIPNCRCFVGETDDNLAKLIHGTMTADVIVVGDQQKMIPKLLANYYDLNRPPVMIVLFNRAVPPDLEKLSLTHQKAAIIPVRLGGDTAASEVARKVRDALGPREIRSPTGL